MEYVDFGVEHQNCLMLTNMCYCLQSTPGDIGLVFFRKK